jgi:hypothetical protein
MAAHEPAQGWVGRKRVVIDDALGAICPISPGVHGDLRRYQPRQRLPGKNHTFVGAATAFRTCTSEPTPCELRAISVCGCVVTNEISVRPR